MNSDERKAIEQTVQTYLDGLYEGDADKLASVFHETSALTYEQGGKLTVLPRDQWLKWVRERGSPQSKGLRARRRDPVGRPVRADDSARQGQVPDPAALLHRLPEPAQDRRALGGGAEGVCHRREAVANERPP